LSEGERRSPRAKNFEKSLKKPLTIHSESDIIKMFQEEHKIKGERHSTNEKG
jgi:hypothetical protein